MTIIWSFLFALVAVSVVIALMLIRNNKNVSMKCKSTHGHYMLYSDKFECEVPIFNPEGSALDRVVDQIKQKIKEGGFTLTSADVEEVLSEPVRIEVQDLRANIDEGLLEVNEPLTKDEIDNIIMSVSKADKISVFFWYSLMFDENLELTTKDTLGSGHGLKDLMV